MRRGLYDRKNIIFSFKCALRGLGFTFYSQRNMIIHSVFGLMSVVLGFYFHLPRTEWLILLLTLMSVFCVETINTAIEISIDLVTKKRRFRAMLAKDIAAGAVFIASINAIIVGYLIFFDRLVTLFFR